MPATVKVRRSKRLCDKEDVAKQASDARSLEFFDNKDYIDTVEVDSGKKKSVVLSKRLLLKEFHFGWTSKT